MAGVRRMARLLPLPPGLLLAALLALACTCGADKSMNTYGGWRTGRGTFYGTDAWSIHEGGCNYGHLSPGEPLGWNVAALSDVDLLYARGVCGFCLEVRCAPLTFTDNYGMRLDRQGACYNANASIVLRIVDTCPCTYAGNAYSNKRWCCGDMPHLDLSYITFQSLAPSYWGVIGLQFRQVPCAYRPPVRVAQPPYDFQDPTYNRSAPLPLRFWPEFQGGAPPPAAAFNVSGLSPVWSDASWDTFVVPPEQTRRAGLAGGPALCAKVFLGGALSLRTSQVGAFAKRTRLSFWMYVGVTGDRGLQAQVADITISISGSKGSGCAQRRIWEVRPSQFAPRCRLCADYWWLWEFSLDGFRPAGSPNKVIRPGGFNGCGVNSVYDLNRIEFRNPQPYSNMTDKYLCLSNIRLL